MLAGPEAEALFKEENPKSNYLTGPPHWLWWRLLLERSPENTMRVPRKARLPGSRLLPPKKKKKERKKEKSVSR